MKRSAVVGQALAVALVAGAALSAVPARADGNGQLALAPLPEVLTQANLFGQPKSDKGAAKGEPKGEAKGEEKGEDHDTGKKAEHCRHNWMDERVRLTFHPIGYVYDHGYTLNNLIPDPPSGFVAKHYTFYPTPVIGLGHGFEVEVQALDARRFGLKKGAALRAESKTFFGGAIQKKLSADKGSMPAISIGVRGVVGPDSNDTLAAYLVGTKRIIGKKCGNSGVFLTAGMEYDRYSMNDRGFLLNGAFTPFDQEVPDQHEGAIKPFVGLNIAMSKKLFLSGEYAPREEWQFNDMWAAKGTILVIKDWGIEGGVRNNGYHTQEFIGVSIGSLGKLKPHGGA